MARVTRPLLLALLALSSLLPLCAGERSYAHNGERKQSQFFQYISFTLSRVQVW